MENSLDNGDVKPFSIAAIGASAGGMEAAVELFKHLPVDTGIAFFYIQHLSPTHLSNLPEIFSRETKMPVQLAEDGAEILPDNIYVLPPAKELVLADGTLRLNERPEKPFLHKT